MGAEISEQQYNHVKKHYEQQHTFSEVTVMAKPPSLAKRRTDGPAAAASSSSGSAPNRYRLLFSLWNKDLQSYVSWQVRASPDAPPRMPAECLHACTPACLHARMQVTCAHRRGVLTPRGST